MEQKDVLQAMRRDHAAELKMAAERLEGTAKHTQIIASPVLSEMTGHTILLKPENLQVTGSFKIRGAYNKIASLTDEELERGIVTASAGNHAQGVAYAAHERGAKATILMPEITPPLKVDATKAYGADVVLHGDVFDEAAAYAIELSQREGMIYVPPFDDYEVLCGQGTIAMEILEDVPGVTDIVVPLGGGGLGAGVALAVKMFRPEVRVIGAIPEGSPAFRRSFDAGHVVPADKVVTSAEGVAVRRPGDLTFALLNEFLDDLVEVSERDINEMILLMLEKHKMVVEAAGAVSLAALEHLNLRSRKFAEAPGEHVVGRQHRHGDDRCSDPEGHDRARPHHEFRGRAARHPRPAGQGRHDPREGARECHRARSRPVQGERPLHELGGARCDRGDERPGPYRTGHADAARCRLFTQANLLIPRSRRPVSSAGLQIAHRRLSANLVRLLPSNVLGPRSVHWNAGPILCAGTPCAHLLSAMVRCTSSGSATAMSS